MRLEDGGCVGTPRDTEICSVEIPNFEKLPETPKLNLFNLCSGRRPPTPGRAAGPDLNRIMAATASDVVPANATSKIKHHVNLRIIGSAKFFSLNLQKRIFHLGESDNQVQEARERACN